MENHIVIISSVRKFLLSSLLFVLAGSIYSQASLPKGAKLKTIKCKDYAAVGYVLDRQFVEGQEITFYNTKKQTNTIPVGRIPVSYNKTELGNTIIGGIYSVKNGNSYLTLITKGSDIQGTFKISNRINGNGITVEPKEAKNLKIEMTDLTNYVEASNSLQKQSEDNYMLKMKFDDRTLETAVSFDYIEQEVFPVINNLFKQEQQVQVLEVVRVREVNYGIVNFDNFVEKANNVKLTYKNGDIFVGRVKKDNNKYAAQEGEYNFTTGEKYTGIIGRKSLGGNYIIVHEQGKTVFSDGTTANGDWTKQYIFTDNEWRQISANSKSLTEIRDKAISFNEEKGYAVKEKLEAAEEKFYAKYPSAKSKSKSKSASVQKGSSAMDDLFPEVSNIKVGMSYQELKETLPLELYNKSLITVQGKQAIYLTPSNSKIQEFLTDKLKMTPEAEAKEILQSLLVIEMALKMSGKSWADAFPTITLLNDKVYSVSMKE